MFRLLQNLLLDCQEPSDMTIQTLLQVRVWILASTVSASSQLRVFVGHENLLCEDYGENFGPIAKRRLPFSEFFTNSNPSVVNGDAIREASVMVAAT